MSHFLGATLLKDGAILVPKDFDSTFILQSNKLSEIRLVSTKKLPIHKKNWGNLMSKEFLKSQTGKKSPLYLRKGEYVTYSQVIVAFNFYGRQNN